MQSSVLSMSDYTHPHPGDETGVVRPSPATATYYPEEGAFYEGEGEAALYDEDLDEEKKDKKKKKKKRKESKRSSSVRLPSRRTEETSESLMRSSSERQSSERKEHRRREDGQRLETKEERHERHERRKLEEMKNAKLRRERRERRRSSRPSKPCEDEHIGCLIPDMHIEQPKGVTLAQEQWEINMPRRPEMNVPKTIEVVKNSAHSLGPEPVTHDHQTRSSSTRSDYERLMQLLGEQSEMPALHPLIAASDQDFQEAFDALARDSVFDDNFEKAFNEFSEHYLALSPWGEDDPMKDTCEKGDKSNKNQAPCGEADSIQIPLTPVSRRGLTSYIPKDLKHGSSSKKEIYDEDKLAKMPGTPTVQKAGLYASALEKSDKKEADGGDEFVEILRTPFYRMNDAIVGDDSNRNDKSNAGHPSSAAHTHESSPKADSVDKTKKRHKKWNILRACRPTTTASK